MKGNFLKDKNNNYETFVALINSNNKILNEDFEKSGVFNFKDIEKAIKSVLYWARVFKFYKKNKVEDKVDTIKSSPEYQLTQLHDDFVIEIKNFNFKEIKPIKFVLLDVDLYLPTLSSLNNLKNNMTKGSILMVDDVCKDNSWDGADQAFHEFVKQHSLKFKIIGKKCGIIEF